MRSKATGVRRGRIAVIKRVNVSSAELSVCGSSGAFLQCLQAHHSDQLLALRATGGPTVIVSVPTLPPVVLPPYNLPMASGPFFSEQH